MKGGAPELWLHLTARAEAPLRCQRCLQTVYSPLEVERSFRFVASEAEAEALDAELEDDVLALPRAMDLRALVEDELLLALPLVPRHDVCPDPLPIPLDEPADEPAEAPAHPFASLARLKHRPQ